MVCPICAAEFRSDVLRCPKCDCVLITVPLPDDGTREPHDKVAVELVELCRPASYIEAMLIKQVLEQHGIPAIVKGAHSLSLLPQLAASGELRVMVGSRSLSDARELYQGYFENDGDTDFILED